MPLPGASSCPPLPGAQKELKEKKKSSSELRGLLQLAGVWHRGRAGAAEPNLTQAPFIPALLAAGGRRATVAETTCDMNTKQMPGSRLNSPNSRDFSRERGKEGQEGFVRPTGAAPVFAAGILVGNPAQSSVPQIQRKSSARGIEGVQPAADPKEQTGQSVLH